MDQANQMPLRETPRNSSGPLIGIVIIVIVLVIGALYFWGASLNKKTTPSPETIDVPLSVSDELGDISADLDATVISGIDADIGAIEKELAN